MQCCKNLTNSRDFVFCKFIVLAPFSCKESKIQITISRLWQIIYSDVEWICKYFAPKGYGQRSS